MKATRYILFATVLTLGIFSIILYTSCNKSKCGSTTCQNGGVCTDNKCVCPTGYSGSGCENGWSNDFAGTYDCSRSDCSPAVVGVNAWKSIISKSSVNGGYTVNISNFDNSNVTVVAVVDSVKNIVISPAAGSYGISARGAMNDKTITLHFTTSAAGGVGGYECSMQMVKE